MATRPVLHRFIPLIVAGQEWQAHYPIPTSLINQGQANESTPKFGREFGAAMRPLIQQYQTSCNAKIRGSGNTCLTCGGRATASQTFPMSQLSAPEPYIVVQVLPTCGNIECGHEALQMMDQILREENMNNRFPPQGQHSGSGITELVEDDEPIDPMEREKRWKKNKARNEKRKQKQKEAQAESSAGGAPQA